tara:strand:- start:93 stop:335 length:243 start_codon:yes stop_codon:yes gene_type:complete
MTEHEQGGFRNFIFSRSGLVLLGFLAVAGFFLWQEHEAHIIGYLPLILLLGLCGGMHFFMHGGHGGSHGSHGDETRKDDK